jgi:O-antigen/teichoic acid export membrane protein
MTVLINIDVLTAKYYLSPESAGVYAALATTGKIVFFGTTIFAGVLLPYVASYTTTERMRMLLLGVSIGITALGTLVAMLAAYLWGDIGLRILFGAGKYTELAGVLPIYFLAMGLLAGIQTLTNYAIGVKISTVIYMLCGGALLYQLLAYGMHSGPAALATALCMSLAVVFIAEFLWILSHKPQLNELSAQ